MIGKVDWSGRLTIGHNVAEALPIVVHAKHLKPDEIINMKLNIVTNQITIALFYL